MVGKAALQLSREIGVQFKTAWVLLMKLNERSAAANDEKSAAVAQ